MFLLFALPLPQVSPLPSVLILVFQLPQYPLRVECLLNLDAQLLIPLPLVPVSYIMRALLAYFLHPVFLVRQVSHPPGAIVSEVLSGLHSLRINALMLGALGKIFLIVCIRVG